MTKAYLASPFFTEKEIEIYNSIINIIRGWKSYDLFVPREHEIANAWDLPNAIWGREVFKSDLQALDEAETVFVLNFGMYSDSGTAWEAGYAFAKGKEVIMIQVMPEQNKDYSLMMLNGSTVTYFFHDNDLWAAHTNRFNILQK